MKLYPAFLSCLALFALGVSVQAAPLRVLFFTKSSGFEHSVIKWENGERSFAEKMLTQFGAAHELEFTFSKDGSLFSPEYLAQFDVVMFYTSGDLLSVGTDGHPAMTPAGKQALLDAVAGGKGFVALHSGSDTFHTLEHGGGNPKERGNRYKLHGEKSDPYIRMLGGEFINHGKQQVARARVVDPKFPGFENVGDAIEVLEEWYSTKDFSSDLHALLVLETKTMEGVDYERPDFPIAWARQHGKGRVWFNAMGHREDVWENPKFQQTLVAGIEWAGGRVKADVPPNLAEAAPQANTLPPKR